VTKIGWRKKIYRKYATKTIESRIIKVTSVHQVFSIFINTHIFMKFSINIMLIISSTLHPAVVLDAVLNVGKQTGLILQQRYVPEKHCAN
jgi:hypothetical protein